MNPAHLEVGRVDRAHGIRGEVLVTLTTNRTERVEPGSRLLVGERVLHVERSKPHHHRWIVAFEGIDDRSRAERLRGAPLFAEPIDDDDELWVHDLIGSTVRDTSGTARGIVTAVEANPASDLLVLDDETLVPLTFVVSGPDDGVIVIDPPPGLLP